MTEQTNTPETQAATPAKAADKPKIVWGNMPQRTVFKSAAEAEEYLAACATRYTDWAEQALAAPAIVTDEEGNGGLDPAVYDAPGFETMVAVLKDKGTKEQKGSVKAIVVAPIPSLELLTGLELPTDDSGKDTPTVSFVREIIRKEMNHRAVKALREAADVATVIDQIPTTLDAYLSSSRDSTGIMATFDELWQIINNTMKVADKRGKWSLRKFRKNELKAAFESKGHALDYYPELEEAGAAGSLFVKALQAAITIAKRDGLDPTIFERWLETRDSKVRTDEDEEEEEFNLDLSDLTAAMLEAGKSDDATAKAGDAGEPAPTEPTETTPAEPANA